MEKSYDLLTTGLLGLAVLTPPFVAALAAMAADANPQIPTRREEIVDTVHGVAVADPYRWLEDVSRPEVQEWMKAQDQATREHLSRIPSLEPLKKRLSELFYVDMVTTPYHRGGRWFYMRRKAKQEKGVLYWRAREKGEDKVLIDPNVLSADGSTSLGDWTPSFDGKYLAYALHHNNADRATLYVREIDTGKDLPLDAITDAKYAGVTWTPDSKGFYYNWLPDDPKIPIAELPGHTEFRYHAVGTDPKGDTVVHPALNDPTRFLSGWISREGRYLVVEIQYGWTRNDIYVKDLKSTAKGPAGDPPATKEPAAGNPATLAAGFKPLVVGRDGLFSLMVRKGTFYLKTNDGAPRGNIFKIDPSRTERASWKEIVHESDAPIDNVSLVGDRLVLSYLRKATTQMEVRDLDGKLIRPVPLPGLGTAGSMIGNPDEDEAYFAYASFTQPLQIYRTSVKSGKTELWEAVKVPADTASMMTEQVTYKSKDGTPVTMFLVHKKGMVRDGNNPVFLTGYGGFNVSQTPFFAGTYMTWMERGGVIAVPNLRGGAEYGEDWHRGGMLDKKQNVFDDFIAAAEYLIAEKVTSPSKLAIEGGSNGGLLVGAAMVQRPELFKAVICAVPLLDMIRYDKFGAGKTWVEEYGSSDDPAQFKPLFAYSPYHHVVQGTAYPAMLMLSADSDDRVDPMHARKFTAAIQSASSSGRPAFLWVEVHAGHGGADLVRKKVEQSGSMLAFLVEQLDVR